MRVLEEQLAQVAPLTDLERLRREVEVNEQGIKLLSENMAQQMGCKADGEAMRKAVAEVRRRGRALDERLTVDVVGRAAADGRRGRRVAFQEWHLAVLSLGGEPSQLAAARARAEAASCTIREQVPGATRVFVDVARVEPRTKACFDLDPAHRWRPFSPVDGGPRHGPAVFVSAARHVAVYDG